MDTAGAYQFYCSIHGGLTPGGMNGVVNVGTADPGPPVDPGKPWETGEEPPDPNALVNDTTAPTVFEEGDNIPPTLELLKATPTEKGARARVEVEEPVVVTRAPQEGQEDRRHQARRGRGRGQAQHQRQPAQASADQGGAVPAPGLGDRRRGPRLPISAAWIDFKP